MANSCPFGALLPFSVSGVTGVSCDLAPIDDSSLLGLERNAMKKLNAGHEFVVHTHMHRLHTS